MEYYLFRAWKFTDYSRRESESPALVLFSFRSCANTSLRLSRHSCEKLTCSHRSLISHFMRSVPGSDGSVMFRRGFVSISKHLRTEVRASVAEEDDGRGVEKANQISLEFLEVQLGPLSTTA